MEIWAKTFTYFFAVLGAVGIFHYAQALFFESLKLNPVESKEPSRQ